MLTHFGIEATEEYFDVTLQKVHQLSCRNRQHIHTTKMNLRVILNNNASYQEATSQNSHGGKGTRNFWAGEIKGFRKRVSLGPW